VVFIMDVSTPSAQNVWLRQWIVSSTWRRQFTRRSDRNSVAVCVRRWQAASRFTRRESATDGRRYFSLSAPTTRQLRSDHK